MQKHLHRRNVLQIRSAGWICNNRKRVSLHKLAMERRGTDGKVSIKTGHKAFCRRKKQYHRPDRASKGGWKVSEMMFPKPGKRKKAKKKTKSIMHKKDGTCYLCCISGNYGKHACVQEHHVFPGADRQNSEETGLKVYL